MEFFTSGARELGPWSVSKAKTGVQCPWKFRHQYLDKTDLPPDKQTPLDDKNLRVGSAVHKYAEEIARGTSPDTAIEIGIEEGALVSDEELTYQGMLSNVDAFEDRLTSFKHKYNVTADYAEKKFGLKRDLSSTGFFDRNVFLRGVMDRTLIVDNRHAVIIDLKTGSYPSLKYAREQIDAYALMALRTWPNVTMVHPALYFAPAGELLWSDKVWEKDYPDLREHPTVKYINKAAEAVATDEIIPGKYCSWCPYKVICLEERKVRRANKKRSGK